MDSVLQSDVRSQSELLVKILKRIFMQRGDMEEEHKKENYVRDCMKKGLYNKSRVIQSFEWFRVNQMIISKNPQFTGISARQQLEFTTHLLLTD